MHRKQLNIFVASALAGLFAIFNIGLPFALYVCPMMANERCTCTCTPPSTDGSVLTFVHGTCCNNSVLAERNTVPFLGTLKYEPPHSEVVFVLSPSSPWAPQQSHHVSILAVADVGPPPPDTPLYLLSSSLLI
ncbi:MAG: hypothetical protein NTZ35_11470 [Ignavibacteriales bacterium]|nr:hypothetical protein [Ignavibacteriales bacterium]